MILQVLKVIIIVLIFLTFYLLMKHLYRENVLGRAVEQVSEQVTERSRLRSRQMSAGLKEKRTDIKLERDLYKSGLSISFPFLTAEVYILIMVISAGSGFFLVSVWRTGIILRIISLCCGPLILYTVLQIKYYLNYRRVEKNLLIFLNLLDSFSITAGELTVIFYKISYYLDRPLKRALEECYFETQITGNTTKALYNLMEKVGHPKFKEVVRNLEVCSRYDADYSSVVDSCRKTILGIESHFEDDHDWITGISDPVWDEESHSFITFETTYCSRCGVGQ